MMREYYSADRESLEQMDNAALAFIAEERLKMSAGTVSFRDMMERFGVTEDDLWGDDVDIEVEPIVF